MTSADLARRFAKANRQPVQRRADDPKIPKRAWAASAGLPRRSVTALTTMLLLAGCASFSPDGGFGTVEQLTQSRIGQPPSYQRSIEATKAAAARVTELLKQPLTAALCVEIALLNHRGLQASYADLGVAESDRVRAGRLPNPTWRLGRLAGQGLIELDRAVLVDVMGLITMPLALQVEERRLEQAQWQAALETVGLAHDVRKAFFEAVAAQQMVGYFEQVKQAADASADLARRMAAAGNFSKLAQLREQAFHADATAQLARARHQAVSARERLMRALAISPDQPSPVLPDRLPDLPDVAAQPTDAEQTAMNTRLDVQMAKRQVEATARALGLTQATRFVNVLHAGYQDKLATGEARSKGFEIELELPLFDFGTARVARAEAIYLQAVNRAAQVAINARSEARESYSAYRTAYDLARHYRDDVVPLRKQMSDENLLRYNGMFISVFDLLADARDQITAVTAAVESLRDHWLAEADLQVALTARSPGGVPGLSPNPLGAAAPAGH